MFSTILELDFWCPLNFNYVFPKLVIQASKRDIVWLIIDFSCWNIERKVMRPVRLDLGSHNNSLSIDFKMDWFGNWRIVHHIERCGGGSHRCKSLGLRKSLETWKEMRKRWVAVGYGAVASCCRLSLLLLLSGSAPRTSGSSRPSKKAGSFHQRRPRRQHISSSCWN